jgi:hypothetical protein
MSLQDNMTQDSAHKCSVVLKTADQYDMWKARVTDACWAACHRNVFDLSDNDCKTGLALYDEAAERKAKSKKGDTDLVVGPPDWVGKCWIIITQSLHDDVYRKVSHIPRGAIRSLLLEVGHALVVNNLEEVPPLRLELYGGTMQKDCGSDLQTWVNFIYERANKLAFLKHAVQEDELIAIFLKGLHPIFQQLQVTLLFPASCRRHLTLRFLSPASMPLLLPWLWSWRNSSQVGPRTLCSL